jgi:hypothetical protein
LEADDGSGRWSEFRRSFLTERRGLRQVSRAERARGGECSNELRLGRGEDKATTSVAHVDGRWQWSADIVGVKVAEAPRRRCAHVGTHWPGHAAMGRRGPCHLNFSLNFKISTNFVI